MSDIWKQFETTGRVEDYLTFCQSRNSVEDNGNQSDENINHLEMLGDSRDGIKCHSDGNGVDSYAHW